MTMTSNGKLFLWASGNRVQIKRFWLTETIRTIDGASQLNVVGTWSGSLVLGLSKSSGNTVNRIIIFGVPECVYIDIEISTVDDVLQGKRLPSPAKTCIFWRVNRATTTMKSCVCLHSLALHSMQMEFCENFLVCTCRHTINRTWTCRCTSTAHLKQLIYFYMVHIIPHFTILFVPTNDENDDGDGDMCAHLTLVPEYISRLNV